MNPRYYITWGPLVVVGPYVNSEDAQDALVPVAEKLMSLEPEIKWIQPWGVIGSTDFILGPFNHLFGLPDGRH